MRTKEQTKPMKTVEDFVATLNPNERALLDRMHQTLGKKIKVFILLDGKPVETDVATSIIWQTHHDSERQIADDRVDDIRVSTVFLTCPTHNGQFETMVFGPQDSSIERRYKTLKEALVGHAKIVAKLQK